MATVSLLPKPVPLKALTEVGGPKFGASVILALAVAACMLARPRKATPITIPNSMVMRIGIRKRENRCISKPHFQNRYIYLVIEQYLHFTQSKDSVHLPK